MGKLSEDELRLRKNARARALYAKQNEGRPKKVTAAMEVKAAIEQGLVKFVSSIPCRTCGCFERYARKKPQCTNCQKQKNKRYEEKYPEKFKEMKKAWYEKNREYCAMYQKAKYQSKKAEKKVV